MRSERKVTRRSLSEKVAAKAANRQNGRNRSAYLLLPDGVEVFKPKKEGNYRFNIIPYIAGKKNRDTEPGELDYEFTFYVHKIGDGDDQRTIVCPKKTYGKPCPVCEQVEKLSKDYVENEQEIKELKAKQRQLFNIVDARDEENKIQIYETSYFKGFGELLDKRLRNFDEDDDDENYGNFADIPGGRTLKVAFAEETFNGNKFFAPSSIDFIARKEELPDEIIDQAVCLDSCLKVLEYDAILKLLAGTDDTGSEEDEEQPVKTKPAKVKPSRASKPTPKDEEEDENEDDEEERPVKKPAKKQQETFEPDEDEDEDEDEEPVKKPVKKPAVEEDEDEDDDDEEERPVKKSKKPIKNDDEDEDDEEDEKPVKKSKKPVVDEEDEEDEDEEDEDEEPVKKPVKKPEKEKEKPAKKGGKCPHGYAWGADCYVYSECDECELCDECDAAQENN